MLSERTVERLGKFIIWSIALNAVLLFALLESLYKSPAIITAAMIALCVGLLAQTAAGLFALFIPGKRKHAAAALVMAPVYAGATLVTLLLGSGWGRPLRVKGRQIHPGLREGSDWTKGDRPDASNLDGATRRALAALWLHDAQKEHASVPAFSRISWMLAAVGAPAELMEWSHRAALEEIDHARRCFALAEGYGGKSQTVEPMPDLLLAGFDVNADPILTLASESLADGCQLEEFNADVAAACAEVCEEPATRAVLEQIAREERQHAEFSWAVLEWTLRHSPQKVRPAIEDALKNVVKLQRPTAVSWDKLALVALADPALMRKHGRLPDERWGELWEIRVSQTRARLEAVLAVRKAA
jgi:hypothetical protein